MAALEAPPIFALAVCDDEPDFRRLLERRLEDDPRFDVKVSVGTFGELNQALLAGAPVDAVILDYMLPGIDGDDAVRVLSARTGTRPVFVMSAATRHHVERRALAAGAAAFFPKDGALRQLVETLHLHLSGQA